MISLYVTPNITAHYNRRRNVLLYHTITNVIRPRDRDWETTDGGFTFQHQNEGQPVLKGTPGQWDSARVLNPTAMLSPDGSKIFLVYKGWGGSNTWSIGYAEASVSAPTSFTKKGRILSSSLINTTFGINSLNNSADSLIYHNGEYLLWGWFFDLDRDWETEASA